MTATRLVAHRRTLRPDPDHPGYMWAWAQRALVFEWNDCTGQLITSRYDPDTDDRAPNIRACVANDFTCPVHGPPIALGATA